MNEPLPNPIDVNLHSGPAEWWQLLAGLAPFAALMAAAIAGWIAWRSLRQKTAADNRAEWWRRAQWAFDGILSEEPRRAHVGMKVLTVLAQATPSSEELRIVASAAVDSLDTERNSSKEPASRHQTSFADTDNMQADGQSDVRSASRTVQETSEIE